METLLELKNISRSYLVGGEQVNALDNISLSIHAGEMIAIVGASGSGKSTLMNILGCLDKPSSGEYWVSGINVADLKSNQLAKLRREHFGFVFQRYHLLTHLTAEQNVEIPAIYSGVSKTQRRERAIQLLQNLGLENRVNYWPNQLSGGQQQRVSIARALMNGGQVILADEPTGALDSTSGQEMMDLLKQLCQQGHTVVIVTHDPNIAAQAQRVIEIKDGRLLTDSRASVDKTVPHFSNVDENPFSVKRIWESFNEALLMAWRAMTANKLRTFLTMLGIIIGIASVVSILVVGDAAKSRVLSDIKSMGTNVIDIYPGGVFGSDFGSGKASEMQSLKLGDVSAIKSQPYAQAVSPVFDEFDGRLRRDNVDIKTSIQGVGSEYFQIHALKFSQGMSFTSDMVSRQAQVVVINDYTRKKVFPYQKNAIGEVLLVNNIPLTIIGVISTEQHYRYGNRSYVWLPYSTMNHRLISQNYIDLIVFQVKDGYSTVIVEDKLKRLLTLRHGREDFNLFNSDRYVQLINKTTRNIQIFLMLVALISLVVGGIGVMNIMLVSVSERTREIGIRMAVGARSSDIRMQFLIESVLVCLIGGILGIALSYSLLAVVEWMLPQWSFVYSVTAFILAFGCSTATGIIFGFLPARNAARLDPIEALARE
ncbi:macrolide-specific ABC-type efflux carrier protein MacB [Xenorhabdus mauleonii]|uniref:Macrolide transport system ATP-binding/permease protein n=1 Tax=Xenorhabdus mauleonii TaxID=351675 RepID=A0A1I3I418_9GAMM|nr:macrolide ABC transporter ATP-binding protein/permease MacB [Xenorhabdus mauleonii]PHM40159.1 macrolide-specific ABC-type efflux carrier protein MacB [Xenorhabdus mauleonii]SFI42716.1 macrolide transport system ATP-binding/permease protein [Xenorhabdus mauleonii]